jgi:hypothetical protein
MSIGELSVGGAAGCPPQKVVAARSRFGDDSPR